MKKLVLLLGLSMTILLSGVFAQERMQRVVSVQENASAKVKKVNRNAKNQVMIRPQACYKSAGNQDKATVKLVVYMEWEEEDVKSGYQILLDNTNTLGMAVMDDVLYVDDYSAVTASVPADATFEIGSTSVVGSYTDPGMDSSFVEPGVYDVFVVNPSLDPFYYEPYIHIAQNGEGVFPNLELEAGMTYVFTVVPYWTSDAVVLTTPYDLAASKVDVPIGNCDIEEAEVKLKITNEGQLPVDSCETFYYMLYLFDTTTDLSKVITSDTIRERIRFSQPLKHGESYTHTFSTKIEFAKDTAYAVWAGIAMFEKEVIVSNNENAGMIARKSPAVTPYNFNIDYFDVAFSAGEWAIGQTEDKVYNIGNLSPSAKPAVTRCVSMKAGETYRFSYEYVAGTESYSDMQEMSSSFGILFGESGTDVSTWDTVYMEEDTLVGVFTPNNILVSPKRDGSYAFGFFEDAATSEGGLVAFRKISVVKVLTKDAKIKNISTNMAHKIPASQANGTFKGNVTVVNWGATTIDSVRVNVALDATTLFSEKVALGATKKEKTVPFEITTSGLKLGDKPNLTAYLETEGDANAANDTAVIKMEVSDIEMVQDYVVEGMYTIKYAIYGNKMVGCGLPFYFTQKDTLTAVSVGWMDLQEDMEVEIAVHHWNVQKDTIGNLIYKNNYRRGRTAGQRMYRVPSIVLEAGHYIFSVRQLGDAGFGLVSDTTEPGLLYVLGKSGVYPQTDMGIPSIRAVFGHDGKPMAKDVAVDKIAKPVKDLGLFSNEESITVVVRNNGYEAVTAPFRVKVNETLLPAQNITLPAFGEGELTFKGDLSAADAEFVLTAFAALEGDEDPGNDTCQKTVRSIPAANPYVLDFEHCPDFAVGGEFVPAWKSLDASGAPKSLPLAIDYPHREEAVGFIAFPEEVGAKFGIVPNKGSKCGVVFGAADATGKGIPSNAWLISPKLKLTAANAKMSFYVRNYVNMFGAEQYNVMVSTTNTAIESFKKVGETREAPDVWTQVTVDLAEYAGKDVYVAIQYVSNDVYALLIDDIVVGNVGNETNAAATIRATVYPNPAREMVLFNAEQAIQQVTVFNVAGNTVYSSADHLNTPEFRYNVKGLTAGMYLARIKTAQGVAVLKFVVR